MTITAKFASVCPCCNGRIQPGTKVEWAKGSKARHVECPSNSEPAKARAAAPRLPKLIGQTSECMVTFEGTKSSRESRRSVGDAAWIKDGGERVAMICVGWEPARWVSADALEDNGNYAYGGRGAYLGTDYFRPATREEYEALQVSTPRLDGVCSEARAAVALSRGLAAVSS